MGDWVTNRLDFMFAELDRQLHQTQQHASTQSQRAGLVTSASTLAATVFVTDLDKIKGGEIFALVLFGFATVAGIVALVPALLVGPTPTKLTNWSTSNPAGQAVTALYDAKVTTLEANLYRLAIMTWAFYLQVVTVLGAVVVALVVTARR